ncbi:hypothetical protein [Sediminivirga luteola]|uniref:hypothetical protein n=1 Tax=Sediminivirga luteola TaxID=1774748 RepID=UPI001664D952|nr:hypothetical protein [Sediminivirga luteola]MCI2264268.1 hypothetical protein [Sediminivirga luteola]
MRQAQRNGVLTAAFPADVLLGLVLHTARVRTTATPEFHELKGRLSRRERRDHVVEAVRRIVSPED